MSKDDKNTLNQEFESLEKLNSSTKDTKQASFNSVETGAIGSIKDIIDKLEGKNSNTQSSKENEIPIEKILDDINITQKSTNSRSAKSFSEAELNELENEKKKNIKQNEPNSQNKAVDGINFDDVDLITKEIRQNIILKQINILQSALSDIQDNDEKKKSIKGLSIEEFKAYVNNPDNQKDVEKILNDKDVQKSLSKLETEGYRQVHEKFSTNYQKLDWEVSKDEQSKMRTKEIKNQNGEVICELKETKIKDSCSITTSEGQKVEVSNHRIIDYPLELKKEGPLHLSMAVQDKNGENIAKDKAVYFTAHYDKSGKLVEVSSPSPVKFNGKGDDAVAYIEKDGEVYTLSVTKGQYKEMMREVSKNRGTGLDISQVIEANDRSNDYISMDKNIDTKDRNNKEKEEKDKGKEELQDKDKKEDKDKGKEELQDKDKKEDKDKSKEELQDKDKKEEKDKSKEELQNKDKKEDKELSNDKESKKHTGIDSSELDKQAAINQLAQTDKDNKLVQNALEKKINDIDKEVQVEPNKNQVNEEKIKPVEMNNTEQKIEEIKKANISQEEQNIGGINQSQAQILRDRYSKEDLSNMPGTKEFSKAHHEQGKENSTADNKELAHENIQNHNGLKPLPKDIPLSENLAKDLKEMGKNIDDSQIKKTNSEERGKFDWKALSKKDINERNGGGISGASFSNQDFTISANTKQQLYEAGLSKDPKVLQVSQESRKNLEIRQGEAPKEYESIKPSQAINKSLGQEKDKGNSRN